MGDLEEFARYKEMFLKEMEHLHSKNEATEERLADAISQSESRLSSKIEKMDNQIQNTRVNVEGLMVKSGVWGVLGGILPATVAIIWALSKVN